MSSAMDLVENEEAKATIRALNAYKLHLTILGNNLSSDNIQFQFCNANPKFIMQCHVITTTAL